MQIRIANTRSKVIAGTPEELEWLDEYLCFEDTSKYFRTSKWSKGNDPYLHLLDKRNNTFPSGLVGMARAAAKKDGVAVSVDDGRKCPVEFDFSADLDWLYEYQFDAVWEAVQKTAGILQLPTGAGKTEIMCGLGLALPCHWLFVVHRKDLVWNAAERWTKRTGWEAGIVGDGKFNPDPERRFTVATFKTLADGLKKKDPRVLKLLADAEGLLVDECHVCPAKSFWKVCMATRRSYFRLGFSGTPLERGDKRSVYAVASLGPLIYKIEEEFLIQLGVLARPHIRVVAFAQDCDAKTWMPAYDKLIVKSFPRNAVVVQMAMRAKKPALVFVRQVEHGEFLAKMLNKTGMRTEFVWGKKITAARQAAVKRLRYGEIDCIVCSVVFQEGVDIPELESVVNAAGMKTTIGALQRIGRGMRSDGGRKKTFEVWDVKDEGNGFMTRHSRNRLKAYRSRGHEIEVLQEEEL